VTDHPLRCSVIIPTYNRAPLLRRTLDSLVAQKLPARNFEVVVIDDGSTDETVETIHAFSQHLNIQYCHQEHDGYRVARARNMGIRSARSPLCVFLDSGVMAHSECLAAHLSCHERATTPLALCGYVYGFNEDNEDAKQIRQLVGSEDADTAIHRLRKSGLFPDLREEFYSKHGDDFSHLPAPWLVFWTCNASAPTSMLKQISMFDENYQSWGAEDIDVGYRLFRAGARVALDRRAASLHYPHPKCYEDNLRDASPNYQYFGSKYGTPITALVAQHHFFQINEIVERDHIPRCEDFDRARTLRSLSAAAVDATGGMRAVKYRDIEQSLSGEAS